MARRSVSVDAFLHISVKKCLFHGPRLTTMENDLEFTTTACILALRRYAGETFEVLRILDEGVSTVWGSGCSRQGV
jgi:hypothetical protein